MTGILKYPELDGGYNKAFAGNTIKTKEYVYVPDQNANYKYAYEEINPTGKPFLTIAEFKKALKDTGKGFTDR